jgi:ankyrin repeat protein
VNDTTKILHKGLVPFDPFREPDLMNLIPGKKAELQNAYRDLVNYQSEDPTAPIEPLDYRNSDDDRLIHIAAHIGDLRTIEILLNAGADINAVGDMGLTAAHYAAMGQHRQVLDYIISRGADVMIVDEFGRKVEETWTAFAENRGEAT